MRHAESVDNRKLMRIGGRSNETLLSEKGKTQSEKAAKFLADHYRIDSWYTSPAVRATETGFAIMSYLGLAIDPVVDDRLQEMSQGIYEGKNRRLVSTPEVLERFKTEQLDFKLEGGESMNEVGDRMYECLTDWNQQTEDGHTSLAITHGLAKRCLIGRLKGWNHEQTYRASTPNCSVTSLTGDGDIWSVDYYAHNVLK